LVSCLRGLYKEGFACEVERVEFYFYMTGTPNVTGARISCAFNLEEEYGDEAV
jgi:hypothetical protein